MPDFPHSKWTNGSWRAAAGQQLCKSALGDGARFILRSKNARALRIDTPYVDILLPKNSWAGVFIGYAAAATAFALVWHIGWLAIAGLLGVVAAMIGRSFVRDLHRTIPASQVEQFEARWLQAVAESASTIRKRETAASNVGLAAIEDRTP